MLNIKHTAMPDGTIIPYHFGMKTPKPLNVQINEMVKAELSKTKNLKRA